MILFNEVNREGTNSDAQEDKEINELHPTINEKRRKQNTNQVVLSQDSSLSNSYSAHMATTLEKLLYPAKTDCPASLRSMTIGYEWSGMGKKVTIIQSSKVLYSEWKWL